MRAQHGGVMLLLPPNNMAVSAELQESALGQVCWADAQTVRPHLHVICVGGSAAGYSHACGTYSITAAGTKVVGPSSVVGQGLGQPMPLSCQEQHAIKVSTAPWRQQQPASACSPPGESSNCAVCCEHVYQH